MTLQQMRHTKLWLAGQAGNWDLAMEVGAAPNFGFNRVQRPAMNPYPNQVFAPVPK
jgi:hypothetical protein